LGLRAQVPSLWSAAPEIKHCRDHKRVASTISNHKIYMKKEPEE